MHAMDCATYFARAVSYMHKILMKFTTGGRVTKLFFFNTDVATK